MNCREELDFKSKGIVINKLGYREIINFLHIYCDRIIELNILYYFYFYFNQEFILSLLK